MPTDVRTDNIYTSLSKLISFHSFFSLLSLVEVPGTALHEGPYIFLMPQEPSIDRSVPNSFPSTAAKFHAFDSLLHRRRALLRLLTIRIQIEDTLLRAKHLASFSRSRGAVTGASMLTSSLHHRSACTCGRFAANVLSLCVGAGRERERLPAIPIAFERPLHGPSNDIQPALNPKRKKTLS